MIGSKLTVVLPDQAVLEKHKFLFWQTRLLCIVVEFAGQGSAISRATQSSSINYPVPTSFFPSMSAWSKKSISISAGLFTTAFASKAGHGCSATISLQGDDQQQDCKGLQLLQYTLDS
jgi:hypothetical protein